MKRVFSSFLILAIVLSVFSGVIMRADAAGGDELDTFVTEVFAMEHKIMFMDMVKTFHKLSDDALDGFSGHYQDIIEALDAMHNVSSLPDSNDNTIYNLVKDFVKEDTVTDDTLANMEGYLTSDPPNRGAFEDAFSSRGITSGAIDALSKDVIERGVGRLDTVFGYLKANESLRINIITRSIDRTRYSDRGNIDRLLNAYFAIGGTDSDEVRQDIQGAFTNLIDYYNNLDSQNDRNIIDGYLYDLGLVYRRTSSGGGTTPTPTPTPTPKDDFEDAIEDEDIDQASDALDGEIDKAETEEEVKTVLDKTKTLVDTADKNLGDDKEKIKKDIKKISQTVQNTGNLIEKIEDVDEAKAQIVGIIESLGKMSVQAKEKDVDSSELENAAEALATKIVKKSGSTKVQAQKDGKRAIADLQELDLSAQIDKAVETAKEMKTILEDNKISRIRKELDSQVNIAVEVDDDADEVDVTLPSLTTAFEKVKNVTVSSKIASFELNKDTVEIEEDDETEDRINLNAREIEDTELDEIKEGLAANHTIPEGAKVINLSASIIKVNKNTGLVETTKPIVSFKERIKVSVPYSLKEGENPNEVSVFLVQADGTIKKVGGVYNSQTKQVEFFRKHFSNYFIAANRVSFDDVNEEMGEMYQDAIEILAAKGLIAGKTEDLYSPDELVTRAEFTALIARLLELEADPAQLPFNDVNNETAWYRNHLAGAYYSGVINGTSETSFHPNNNINRQEAAAILANAARFLGYNDAEASLAKNAYSDHNLVAPWALRSVATIHRDGLATGMFDTQYQPKVKVTRAETAVLIYNMLFKY